MPGFGRVFLCRPDYPGHRTDNVIRVIRRCAGVPADNRRAGSAGRVRPWHARGRRPPPSIASIVLRRRSGWPRTRGPPGAPPGSRRRARCRWCSDTVAAIRYEVLPGGWRTLPRVRAGRIRQASPGPRGRRRESPSSRGRECRVFRRVCRRPGGRHRTAPAWRR